MSLRKGLCMASNGWMMAMVPATTAVTNTPAPASNRNKNTESQQNFCEYRRYSVFINACFYLLLIELSCICTCTIQNKSHELTPRMSHVIPTKQSSKGQSCLPILSIADGRNGWENVWGSITKGQKRHPLHSGQGFNPQTKIMNSIKSSSFLHFFKST